eukprot:XP_011673839.1 PREDICTED: uncharacterized protein LOC100890010 [Strongylocentrotus purpuratus]
MIMETMLFWGIVLIGCFSSCSGSVSSTSRFCVIENRVGSSGVGSQRMLAFRSNTTASPVSVEVSYGDVDPSSAGWSSWKNLGAPMASPPLSNPVCEMTEQNQTQIFVQASDGQVYSAIQDTLNFLNFSSWKKVGSNSIPVSLPNRSTLVDSVSAVWYGKQLMVFARSISTSSRLYWCKGMFVVNRGWTSIPGLLVMQLHWPHQFAHANLQTTRPSVFVTVAYSTSPLALLHSIPTQPSISLDHPKGNPPVV